MIGYDALLEVAEREEGVLALFLGGSRGKGALVGPESDYDVYLVARDPDELERFPLPGEAWRAARLLPLLERIVATDDVEAQQRLFRDVERLARDRRHADVIDAWEPDVGFLRGA